MLLVKVGLSEDEADAFLEKLRSEISQRDFKDDSERRELVDSILNELHTRQSAKSDRMGALRRAVYTIVLGVVGNAIWDLLKSEIGSVTSKEAQGGESNWREKILIEWSGVAFRQGLREGEPLLRRALELRQRRLGRNDHRTAVSLDSLAMCLDMQGRHREARPLRARVLRIEREINGQNHESTGAAFSNLGLCLCSLGNLQEGIKALAMGSQILMNRLGLHDISTAAAAYSLCTWVANHPTVDRSALPQSARVALPRMREVAEQMMARKMILTLCDASLELMENVQLLLRTVQYP